jgi:endonuclease/exonuclease/phosphatase family metal-dependent hydrolase
MNRLFYVSFCLCFIFSTHQAFASDEIEVATLNQYIGADLSAVFNASSEDAFNDALVSVLQQIAASDFPARALEQGQMLAKRSPDIIGLQEVLDLSCLGDGCDDPSIAKAFVDNLPLTLDALSKHGVTYLPAAIVKNFDLPGIPFNINGSAAFLFAVDRDVLLSREDVAVTKVDWSVYGVPGLCPKPSLDGCNYQTVTSATTPFGPLAIERGFVAVDATVGNRVYRIFNTHFEISGVDAGVPEFTFFQAAQAYELIQTISASTPPDVSVIVLGDMNSSPEHADIGGTFPAPFGTGIITPYHQFLASAFYDVWELRPGKVKGYTCCQQEDLGSQQALLTERIDMVFTWDMPDKVHQVRVLGDKVSTKTNPPGLGLWSTDHGGMAALLQFR